MECFLLLDAARLEYRLIEAIQINKKFKSLYIRNNEKNMESVAPYLFEFDLGSSFKYWFCEKCWSDSCGLLIFSKFNFEENYRHFLKFILIETEVREELYFRFYDPRVLKIFLPTCDKNQILEFFGPIESFICEGDTKEEAIRFWQVNGELKQEILPVEKVFGNITTLTTVTPS